MGRRKKSTGPVAPKPCDSWEIKTEIQVHGRNVFPGTELKIKGNRGRFRFIKYVKTETAEWVDVWGGPKHCENWRSFTLEQIVRVHYKNTTDKHLSTVYKEKRKAIKEATTDSE